MMNVTSASHWWSPSFLLLLLLLAQFLLPILSCFSVFPSSFFPSFFSFLRHMTVWLRVFCVLFRELGSVIWGSQSVHGIATRHGGSYYYSIRACSYWVFFWHSAVFAGWGGGPFYLLLFLHPSVVQALLPFATHTRQFSASPPVKKPIRFLFGFFYTFVKLCFFFGRWESSTVILEFFCVIKWIRNWCVDLFGRKLKFSFYWLFLRGQKDGETNIDGKKSILAHSLPWSVEGELIQPNP